MVDRQAIPGLHHAQHELARNQSFLGVNGDSKLIQISFEQRFKTDTPQIP
jgi:hypothetical protein